MLGSAFGDDEHACTAQSKHAQSFVCTYFYHKASSYY